MSCTKSIPGRWLLVAAVVLWLLPAGAATRPRVEELDQFTVPPGFEVMRAAGPPLVNRPIVADFDERGRLYVADSSGSNAKVEKQLEERPHRIVRLEDRNGDGEFDTSVVFADRMMFPEGAMWLDGSLYVAAPPSIWKLTDTDDDGVADRREEWFQGKTLTGCANDLHGPYAGPDGLIYWTKGAFAEQTYTRPGAPPLVTRASHIFRRRPGDGTPVEPVMTGGMDNPVDVAFTAAGERILTATFLEHPQHGRRDALVHAVYGGVYGKPHAVLDGHQRTGELMPIMTHLGPAVPAGLTRYSSRVFGEDYRDNFFAAMFNVHKVTRNILRADGATFRNDASDFLVSSRRDFHPTDVLEDADGSLLVIDTGPWYKLCCPTSQIAKPDVLGAIYRVRRTGARKGTDPRGLALPWEQLGAAALAALLDDERSAVRARAIQQLAKLGHDAVPALAATVRGPSREARKEALWALTRIDAPAARAAARAALDDADETVRQTAIYAAGLWRDRDARPWLVEALAARSPAIRRAAAEGLGRLGDAGAVPHLVAAAALTTDRVLEHSLTYALIEIGDPVSTAAAGLEAAEPRAKRAALIALDQMQGGGLEPQGVIPLLDSPEPLLHSTAWWIAGRRPEWGAALVPYFERHLDGVRSLREGEALASRMSEVGGSAQVQAFLAAVAGGSRPDVARGVALRAMARTRLKTLPPAWAASIARTLRADGDGLAADAVSVLRAVPASKEVSDELASALLDIARDDRRPAALRLDALSAALDARGALDGSLFAFLRASLEPTQPPAMRAAAAGIIERSKPGADELVALAPSLERAGPLELPRLLRAFDHGSTETVGAAMLTHLERARSRSALRADLLRPRLASYPPSVQRRGEALIAELNVDAATQARRLDALQAGLAGGDVRRGQEVFNSPKAGCVSCHAIGYMGGRIGPDLTRIGQVRSERDLLEAIVYPSASFARSYEPIVVETMSGRVHAGVLRADVGGEVVVGTVAGDDIRVPREDIRDMRPGTASLMPEGLDEQLTPRELADLLAFLKATRSGAN